MHPSSQLKVHLKAHSGGKVKRMQSVDFASSNTRAHSGEKSNECNHCDYASYHASALRAHMKTHKHLEKLN